MPWLDEIAHSGAHDIYEMAVLSLAAPQAVEFLVQECQSKDRLIKILSTILKQESGDTWWQMYAEHIANPGTGLQVVGDIPL
jgi:hypothetical protein